MVAGARRPAADSGIAGAAFGALQSSGGELLIAISAILSVLGMVLLTPLVLGMLGRVARLLPLPARFAVRDAARHRSRTAPAVAAVAATVAGVVALGIGGMSDAAQNRAMYSPTAPDGVGVIVGYDIDPRAGRPSTHRAAELPGARTTLVHGFRRAASGGRRCASSPTAARGAGPASAPASSSDLLPSVRLRLSAED